MRKIDKIEINTGPAVGADGSATATAHSPHVNGRVQKVHIAYLDSPPALTTDVTLKDESDPAAESIASLADAATDKAFYPRRLLQDNEGTDLTTVYDHYVVDGRLEATIDQANADDYAVVTVWLEVS